MCILHLLDRPNGGRERKERNMKNRQARLLVFVLGVSWPLAGCGNGSHDATEAAINAAQTAINASKDAAEQFAPEQMKAAQIAVDEAKRALAKSDYTTALGDAQNAAQKAREAVATASARKEEWKKSWDSMSASAPKYLNEVQARVDMYTKYGRLPKGVDSTHMEEARIQFEQLKQTWVDVTADHKSGHWIEAMKKSAGFKEGLQKLRESLGLSQ